MNRCFNLSGISVVDAMPACLTDGEGRYPRILVIDDDEVDRRGSQRLLVEIFGAEQTIDFAPDWETAVQALEARAHDIYLVDYHLGSGNGLDLIKRFVSSYQTCVFILLTGQESRAVDMAAMRAGVADYLVKSDLNASRLERSLRYAQETLRQKHLLLKQAHALQAANTLIEQEAKKHKKLAEDLAAMQEQLRDALVDAEENEHRYRWLAQHDLLTGIPNRSLFANKLHDSIGQTKRTGQHCALFLLDLDGFKQVNDTHGHKIGDALLTAVASRTVQTVRTTDVVARLGGDEFAIIINNLNQNSSAAVAAEKVIAALARPFDLGGRRLYIGTSIGIATFDGSESVDPGDLLHGADVALYRAKASGRGTYRFFDDDLNQEVQRVCYVGKELAGAIQSREISVEYQPKFDLATRKVAGIEVLARWRHREIGQVGPAEFVPIAESTGQIIALSDLIFDMACEAICSWKGTAFEGVPVALNLSAVQLRHRGLVSSVSELLARHRVPASMLQFEITETAALESLPLAVEQLGELRELGIGIAVDDFGTGYSSVKLATTLPADYLKIDQSFVSEMLDEVPAAAAVNTTITLAHSLNMGVVAEGVETEQQLRYLQEQGCNEAQGYFFSRPLSAVALLDWHRSRSLSANSAA